MKSLILVAAFVLAGPAACTTEKPASADSATTGATATAANASTKPGTAVTPPSDTQTANPPATATELPGKWQVTAAGIGGVKAGMSLNEANAVLDNAITIPVKLAECDYVRPKSPNNLAFMVENGKISRVDIQPGSDIETVEGAKIGDSEDRIKSLYPGVEIKPAKYTPGHYLEVTPKNGGNNRIVFETDGKKVVKYRSGSLPAVEYVEGCG